MRLHLPRGPFVVRGYRVGTVVKCVAKEVVDDDLLGLAAELAYYAFFSLFPLLLFLTPLFSLVGDKETIVNALLGRLGGAVPPAALSIITAVVRDVVFAPSAPALISTGAVLALWAGSNVFNSITGALNKAYDLEEGRPWWKTRLIAIAMVIISGIVLGTATLTFLAGDDIIAWVARLLQLDSQAALWWTIGQYVLTFLVLVALAWLSLFLLPAMTQRKRVVLVGAVVTTVLWVLVTLGFRFYVQNFGNYNKTYGSIGGVIVLLTWMYLSMLVLLIGGEVNSELAKGAGRVKPGLDAVVLHGDRIGTGEVPRTSVDRDRPPVPSPTSSPGPSSASPSSHRT